MIRVMHQEVRWQYIVETIDDHITLGEGVIGEGGVRGEDNGASEGGGGYSGGGSGTHQNKAGGGGGSFFNGSSCSGASGGNFIDDGIVHIVELPD